MNKHLKISSIITMLLLSSASPVLFGEPRKPSEANSGALLKLQASIKTLTDERDGAQAEIAKLAAENQLLKDKQQQLSADNVEAVTANERLFNEVTAQKNSYAELRSQLDKTNAQLQESLQSMQQLNQVKAELNNSFSLLQAKHQETGQALKLCTEHNIKLSESATELLGRYQAKGTLASMLQDEPLLQFQSVEIQNIVQDYQDKLNASKYPNASAETQTTP